MNLSDYTLSTHQQEVLAKGPRFAITPAIKTINFAAPIETALQMSMKWASRPVDNLSKEEQEAIKSIRENDKIKVLKADKDNATVVLNATEYDEKVRELSDAQTSYKLLMKDATRTIERNTLKLLRELKSNSAINETFYNSVRPSEGSCTPTR